MSTIVRPAARRPEHVLRAHDAAAVEADDLAPLERAARGPVRDTERIGRGDVEAAGTIVLAQRVADGAAPVRDGEGLEPVVVALDDGARAKLHDLERVRQPADHDAERPHQRGRSARPVDGHRDLSAAQGERLQHARQAEDVIGVQVREEDVLEIDEPGVGAEELPLRSLAAVDEEAIPTAPQEGGRGSAGRRRRGRGGAEEDEIEVHGRRS